MTSDSSQPSLSNRLSTVHQGLAWCRWLALFLLIWCAKLWTIRQHGVDVPFGDEWPAEWQQLIRPFHEGTLTWGQMFGAFNEHRILMTRIFVLLLFKLNGLWDPMLQMAVQAGLHAAAMTFFLYLCTRKLGDKLCALFLLVSAPLWLLPFGWENVLFGFQSQFYFVITFGLVAIWLIWRSRTFSIGWWLGVALSLAGLFTMASGVLASVVCTGISALRVWESRSKWRKEGPAFLALLMVTIIGLLLVPHVEQQDSMKARNVGELVGALLEVLSWPERGRWTWLLFQTPFVLLTYKLLRSRVSFRDYSWLMIFFGMWGWLLSLALAYGRGHVTALAPRYLDLYFLTTCASLTCLLQWLQRCDLAGRTWTAILISVWIFAVVHGSLYHFTQVTVPEMDRWTETEHAQRTMLKNYLESRDPQSLIAETNSYPAATEFHTYLDETSVTNLLPTSLQPPLGSSREASDNAFFTRSFFAKGGKPAPGQQRYWSSYGPEGTAHRGKMELTFAGAPRNRWLEFFVSGLPHAPGMSLELTDKNGHSQTLAPSGNPGAEWSSVLVKVPPGKFAVKMQDDSATEWLAMTNPREVGPLSRFVERLIGLDESSDIHWISIPLLAAAAALLWSAPLLWRYRQQPDSADAPSA